MQKTLKVGLHCSSRCAHAVHLLMTGVRRVRNATCMSNYEHEENEPGPVLAGALLMGSAEMSDTDVLSMRGAPDRVAPDATEHGPWAGVGLPSCFRCCISFCTLRSSRYTCKAQEVFCSPVSGILSADMS